MESLKILLPFQIHECWFRIINQDLITFDSELLTEDVPRKVLNSYVIKGFSYADLVDKREEILNRLKRYQLQSKQDLLGNCEQIFFGSNEKLGTTDEIRSALSYNVDLYYSEYLNRYKEWQCEAYNNYYPKYNQAYNNLFLWEEDFVITLSEIEDFVTINTQRYLDMFDHFQQDQDLYNERLRLEQRQFYK